MTKDEAIDDVEVSNAEWIEKAEKLALSWLMWQTATHITSDEVWLAVKAAGLPREPRAMGALMRRLQRVGRIEANQIWHPSSRRACHRRPVRWWRVV